MRKVLSKSEKRLQAISFAYGNTHLSNPNITREMVEAAYDRLHPVTKEEANDARSL